MTVREILVMFLLATMLQWAVRILVKNVFDVLTNSNRSIRVLIYGAMSGGVGIAKNIRSQKPSRYRVKGFISHDGRYRHNRLMGEKVYSLDDDLAETPEHDVRLMMAKDFPEVRSETIVTSICKKERMERIFADYMPDYVFHAAAYKHVPMMENNPTEAVQNNIQGTKIIADLAVKYNARKFVMVSTDKAVNPTNVMGCSKRICEIYVQALNNALKSEKGQKPTQFVTTRFGNVLGSNGSVIPLFQEQIRNGGPVTVTHPNIIRYFMLIPEACKLVLEAGTKGKGGEIFVFDMGKPVKIADLAQRMIKLSGAKNVRIQYTGLRAGEKLYEEVLNEEENTKPSFHDKIRIAQVREYDYKHVSKDIDALIALSGKFDDLATVKKMKEIVPEYRSNNSIYEELDR